MAAGSNPDLETFEKECCVRGGGGGTSMKPVSGYNWS